MNGCFKGDRLAPLTITPFQLIIPIGIGWPATTVGHSVKITCRPIENVTLLDSDDSCCAYILDPELYAAGIITHLNNLNIALNTVI